MRNVDIGPEPEVPKFADGPDIDTAAKLAAATDAKANTGAKVEELRGHCRQAFDVHATALDNNAARMTKIELELTKWSHVAVTLRDAIAVVDGNLREHAEAAGRTNDEVKEMAEAVTKLGAHLAQHEVGIQNVN